MIKTLKKTKLSPSMTSRRIRTVPQMVGGEPLDVKYGRYLARLKSQGIRAKNGNSAPVASASGTVEYAVSSPKPVKARRR